MSLSLQKAPAAAPNAGDQLVEANERVTGSSAVVLLVLFPIEVVTVLLGVNSLLTLHVFIGLMVVPPLLVKMGSVVRRFLGYYRGNEAFRRKGPPPPLLRMIGPLFFLATVILFSSGYVLFLAPSALGGSLRYVHLISFDFWLLLVVIHVVAHAKDIRRISPRDWSRRARVRLPGVKTRRVIVIGSVAIGIVFALALVGNVNTYRHDVRQMKSPTIAQGFSHRQMSGSPR